MEIEITVRDGRKSISYRIERAVYESSRCDIKSLIDHSIKVVDSLPNVEVSSKKEECIWAYDYESQSYKSTCGGEFNPRTPNPTGIQCSKCWKRVKVIK